MSQSITRTYELTYLLSGSLTDNEVAQVKVEIENMLKKSNAKILKSEEWGRKQLAYVIKHDGKKNTDAMYIHIQFEAPADQAQAIDRAVNLSNKIMRHLVVVVDERALAAAANAPVETKEE